MKTIVKYWLGWLIAFLLRIRGRAYPFAPGTTLIVAPHADDETLGCGGLIAAKARRGDPVQVVFVSDSAGSPEDHPAPGLAGQRRAESLAALAVLGVPAASIHFVDAPDGRLNRLTATEFTRVKGALAALIGQIAPQEIFLPYLGEGSTEHDATVHLARAALATTGQKPLVWEYTVWAWWDPRRLSGQLLRSRENFHLVLGPDRALKRTALDCHASQMVPLPATGEPALPAVVAALCSGPVEFYFNRQP